MAALGLATRVASTSKAEPARTPALKPHAPSAIHAPPGFLSGAGNLAIQRKLTIGSVDDPLEHEADRVAEHVMRMPSGLGRIDSSAPQVQRKCSCGGTCDSCRSDEEHWTVQRKSAARPSIGAAGAAAATTAMHAPPIVHEVLRSPGQPLPSSVRTFFEPRFGADFSQVRVHTDTAAQRSAQDLNANAYTAGQNVVFGSGRFAPETQEGRRLLAHELTHVVQQSGSATGGGSSIQPQGIVQRQMCTGILNAEEVPGRTRGREVERLVRVELISLLGAQNVIPSIPIPGASSRLYRMEDCGGFQTGKPAREGYPDLAVREYPRGRTLELAEVKIGTWPCLLLAETQVQNYVNLADGDQEYKQQLGVERVALMPMGRFTPPQLYAPDGTPVAVGWCAPGVIVYKAIAAGQEPDEEPQEQEPQQQAPQGPLPGSGPLPLPSIPALLKLGAKVAALLLADGLLSSALSFVGSFALALTPLLALAALAIGIMFLVDKIKAIAHLIASAAKLVWKTVSAVVAIVRDTIKEIGIKIGEIALFVGGVIKDIAEKIAEGLLWVGGKIISGAKWLGGKIAEGAEAVWDWLFGDDVEPLIPKVELPITEEPTMRCGTVAYEDALIQIESDLLFPFGKYKLTDMDEDKDRPKDKPKVDDVLKAAAAKVLATPRVKDTPVRFLGYTDVIGEADDNQTLSEQRANAVADWFVEHGIFQRSEVTPYGFGESQAKAQASDAKGREKDRRVDILVTKPGSGEQRCW